MLDIYLTVIMNLGMVYGPKLCTELEISHHVAGKHNGGGAIMRDVQSWFQENQYCLFVQKSDELPSRHLPLCVLENI